MAFEGVCCEAGIEFDVRTDDELKSSPVGHKSLKLHSGKDGLIFPALSSEVYVTWGSGLFLSSFFPAVWISLASVTALFCMSSSGDSSTLPDGLISLTCVYNASLAGTSEGGSPAVAFGLRQPGREAVAGSLLRIWFVTSECKCDVSASLARSGSQQLARPESSSLKPMERCEQLENKDRSMRKSVSRFVSLSLCSSKSRSMNSTQASLVYSSGLRSGGEPRMDVNSLSFPFCGIIEIQV